MSRSRQSNGRRALPYVLTGIARTVLAFGLLALLVAPATRAQDEPRPSTIFLPWVEMAGSQLVACGPSALPAPPPTAAPDGAALATLPSAGNWQVICGGFGRIRDLVRLPGDSTDEIRALAIGDGAATLVVDLIRDRGSQGDGGQRPPFTPVAEWAGVTVGPRSEDLTGLLALYVLGPEECEQDSPTPCFWAVGEHARLAHADGVDGIDARFDAGWRRYDTIEEGETDVPNARLNSIVLRNRNRPDRWPTDTLNAEINGWAVGWIEVEEPGEEGKPGKKVAYMAELTIDENESLTWRRRTWDINGPGLPPLMDVQALAFSQSFGPAWMVGGDEDGPMFANLVESPLGGIATWQRVPFSESTVGTPREIALRSSNEGWAFGSASSVPGGAPAAALWQLAPWGNGGAEPSPSWSAAPGRVFQGQSVVDAYQARASEQTYLALTPAGRGSPVVMRIERPEFPPAIPDERYEDWWRTSCWGGSVPPGTAASIAPSAPAHSAFAPLTDTLGVLALGDSVWLLPMDTIDDDTPLCGDRAREPTLLRERLHLTEFAPRIDGNGWAIVRDDDGEGQLVEHSGGRLMRRPDLGLPRNVLAIDHAHPVSSRVGQPARDKPTTWALTADGRLWREEKGARWQPVKISPDFEGRLLTLDVLDDGSVWAAGMDTTGNGRVLQYENNAWRDVATMPAGSFAPTTLALDRLAVARAGDAYFGIAGIAGGTPFMEFTVGAKPCPDKWTPPDSGNPCAPTACCFIGADPLSLVDVAVAEGREEQGLGPAWRAYSDQIFYRPAGTFDWGVETVLAPADHCPGARGVPCRPPQPSTLIGLEAAGPDDLWAVWHDLRLGADRASSHVIRRRGPWELSPEGEPTPTPRPWTRETIVQVPVSDLRLNAPSAEQRQLWLTGDWSTLLRWSDPD